MNPPTECIVRVRRFLKPDRVEDFVRWFARQPPVQAEGLIAKWLTRPADAASLPAGLSGFHVGGNPGCVTLIIVERSPFALSLSKGLVPCTGACPRERASTGSARTVWGGRARQEAGAVWSVVPIKLRPAKSLSTHKKKAVH